MKMSPGSNIQMRLLEAEALAPLPVDSSHYVAVLQNKTGELSALRHASDQVWERLTPLLEFVGPKTAKNPLTATSVDGWVKRANDALGCRPLYIDILRLDPSTSVQHKNGVSTPVLDYIYGAARKRRMRFVPVLRVSEATENQVKSVQAAVASDGHGLGLRYRILEVLPPPGLTHRAVLEAQLESLKQTPQDCDLLIDLEYIDEDRDIDANLLAGHLAMMSAVGDWRSVVILGTSIPKMMGAIKEGTVGTIPRREWELARTAVARNGSAAGIRGLRRAASAPTIRRDRWRPRQSQHQVHVVLVHRTISSWSRMGCGREYLRPKAPRRDTGVRSVAI